MLTLIVPRDTTEQLVAALRRAGNREIGGVLMAEHISTNRFILRDVTIQRRGTISSFIRKIEEALSGLKKFFVKTGNCYTQFNYIGEWHSHPSFSPIPSIKDHESMHDIITDPLVGANFIVLIIVKLNPSGKLIGTVHTYLPNGLVEESTLVIEE